MADNEKTPKQQTLPNFSDFVKNDSFEPPTYSAKDMVNRQFILLSYRFEVGNYGEFPVMECQDPSTGDVFFIQGGGDLLLAGLKSFPHEALPVMTRIKQYGVKLILG